MSTLISKRNTQYFNPRSPHGERRGSVERSLPVIIISIHAPRMGSDKKQFQMNYDLAKFQSTLPACGATTDEERFDMIRLFQSTLPAWGATIRNESFRVRSVISIHAPRMGSDKSGGISVSMNLHFNPRSPHGERLRQNVVIYIQQRFQSTLPAWGATP